MKKKKKKKKKFLTLQQKKKDSSSTKDNKPLRRAERQHTRGALLILGSNEIHRDTLLPKFILYLMVSANRYYHITRIGINIATHPFLFFQERKSVRRSAGFQSGVLLLGYLSFLIYNKIGRNA